jgi:hypothetical protein
MSDCQRKCEQFCRDEVAGDKQFDQALQESRQVLTTASAYEEEFTYNKHDNKDGLELRCPTNQELSVKTIEGLCNEEADCIGFTRRIVDDEAYCLIQNGGPLVPSEEFHFYEKSTGEEQFPLVDEDATPNTNALYESIRSNFIDMCVEVSYRTQVEDCKRDAQAALDACKNPCYEEWGPEFNEKVPESCSVDSNLSRFSMVKTFEDEKGQKMYSTRSVTCEQLLRPHLD